MSIALNKTKIFSFVSDVLPIELAGDGVGRDSEVSWRIEGDAALIRTFARTGTHTARNCALITLLKEGNAKVIAEYQGKEYTAEITVRPMKTAATGDKLEYYIGDMHDHTSVNHNPDQFATHEYGAIEDYLKCINDEARTDFGVISDHAGVTNDYDFYRGFALTRDKEAEDSDVIVFAGAESEIMYAERDRLDVLHRLSGEIVTINSAGYADVKTWEEFYSEMSYSPRAIAIFAHPHVVGFSTNGIWNFSFNRNNSTRMVEIARGIEMGNGEDRKENLLHEYAYSAALDAGFRLSTTCASDSHGPKWGYGIMPGKTVIMAYERSREAFLDALYNNRFYGCESGNVKVEYTVNGVKAPADLAPCETYDFVLNLGYFREDFSTRPVKIDVISDYGREVLTLNPGGENTIRFTVKSNTARYFYLRLVDSKGRKTWSVPVFLGRPYDEYREPQITPIDMSKARAYCADKEVPEVINGNPFESMYGTASSATVDIILENECTISAVGYYPHIVLRGKDKGPDWTTSMESAAIVSRYRVSYSRDGESFTECALGKAQVLGSENIIEFEPVNAKVIRFEALSTVGNDSMLEKYKDFPVRIGNLALFSPKEF